MQEHTLQLTLAYIAVLVFMTAVLISQPKFAFAIILGLAAMLSYSCGTALATLHHLSNERDSAQNKHYLALLTTHAGGAFCYTLMLGFSIHQFY